MNNQFDICVVGSASFDLFLILNNFPVEGETIQANKSFIKNGGKGANQAVAASKLNAKTTFAGQFGDDEHGKNLTTEMTQFKVDLSSLRITKEIGTGQAIIMLNSKGDNQIVIVGGANTFYKDLTQLPQEYCQAIEKSSLLQLQNEIPTEITTISAVHAKSKGKLVMLDCGGRDDAFPQKLIENLDFISPNSTELLRVIKQSGQNCEGMNDIQMVRQILLKRHPNLIVVLKKGSQGSAVITKDLEIDVKSVTLINDQILKHHKIVDTTGAGDNFTSAFCTRYLELKSEGKDKNNQEIYKECLLFANSSAFVCITVEGAMPSQPLRETVDEFRKKFNLY